jgi:hypothetical protein
MKRLNKFTTCKANVLTRALNTLLKFHSAFAFRFIDSPYPTSIHCSIIAQDAVLYSFFHHTLVAHHTLLSKMIKKLFNLDLKRSSV